MFTIYIVSRGQTAFFPFAFGWVSSKGKKVVWSPETIYYRRLLANRMCILIAFTEAFMVRLVLFISCVLAKYIG